MSTHGHGGSDDKSIVNSVLKALAVLECFTKDRPQMTANEVAERTGLNKGTVHRLISTMVQAGWLIRAEGSGYRPSAKLFQLGATALGAIDIRADARPLLSELSEATGDTSYLMIAEGTSAVCIDRVEGTHPVRVSAVDVGTRLPLNLGAAPLAILAFRADLRARLSAADVGSFTEHSTTDLQDLDRCLGQIRRQGYSVSLEDVLPDVAAIGAPVFNSDGEAVAAVSVGGVAARFSPDRVRELGPRVIDIADRLSARLGHVRGMSHAAVTARREESS